MGWSNSHLYEIRAGGIGWGVRVAHSDFVVHDAARAHLIDVLQDVGRKTLKYLYDFGDGWEHTVKVERVLDAVPGLLYPILIDAQGGVARPKIAAAPGATPISSRYLPAPTTPATPT